MLSENHLSKIFIRNLTVLDCAVWDFYEGPVGRSWNVDVEWEGMTDQEGILIDFSLAKSQTKKIIDTFFDHRLLISQTLVQDSKDGRVICHPHKSTPHGERFLVETYPDSLCILTDDVFEDLSKKQKVSLETVVAQTILKFAPKNITCVKVRLSEHGHAGSRFFFNYLHSLKHHDGNCQRFHGHANTIEVFSNKKFDPEMSAKVADVLNKKYLVASDYQHTGDAIDSSEISTALRNSELDSSEYLWTSYVGTQGRVYVRVPKTRLIFMPTESTIENISQWVHKNLFKSDPTFEIHAFEGLNKGAISP